jgi:hypothetical protein
VSGRRGRCRRGRAAPRPACRHADASRADAARARSNPNASDHHPASPNERILTGDSTESPRTCPLANGPASSRTRPPRRRSSTAWSTTLRPSRSKGRAIGGAWLRRTRSRHERRPLIDVGGRFKFPRFRMSAKTTPGARAASWPRPAARKTSTAPHTTRCARESSV